MILARNEKGMNVSTSGGRKDSSIRSFHEKYVRLRGLSKICIIPATNAGGIILKAISNWSD